MLHQLPSKSETDRSDVVVHASAVMLYCRLGRAFFQSTRSLTKVQNPRCLFRDSLHFLLVVDIVMVKSTCGFSVRRVSRHVGTDVKDITTDGRIRYTMEALGKNEIANLLANTFVQKRLCCS